MDRGIWKVVKEGPFVHIHKIYGVVVSKHEKDWIKDDKQNVKHNLKVKIVITTALDLDKFLRVSHCETAKEIRDILQITHEGAIEVKRARLGTLTHIYEIFIMKHEEDINQMQR